jgi:hypothetical protein
MEFLVFGMIPMWVEVHAIHLQGWQQQGGNEWLCNQSRNKSLNHNYFNTHTIERGLVIMWERVHGGEH